MPSNEPLCGFPGANTRRGAPAVALDADFNVRWTAWVARGQAHEELVRRKLVVLAGLLAMGTAIVYDLAH